MRHIISSALCVCAAAALLSLSGCNGKVEVNRTIEPDTAAYNKVVLPSGAELLVYNARQADTLGKAVVILPGGGYCHLAKEHEGKDVAAWMSAKGITAFVLFYNMPNGDWTVPNNDAKEAFDYARAHASELGGYTKVGVMGSSAGGHLASTVATHTNMADFQILLYPVITMNTANTHRGSHDFLLGTSPSADDELKFSNEKQVTAQTPEAFIALSLDDYVVPALPNGVAYAEALTEKGIPTTLVCFPRGGHGWGWRPTFEFQSEWKGALFKFLFGASADQCSDSFVSVEL